MMTGTPNTNNISYVPTHVWDHAMRQKEQMHVAGIVTHAKPQHDLRPEQIPTIQ